MSNTQTTQTTNTALPGGGKQTYLSKTHFDRALLAYARSKFVHAKFGQKRHIPKNSGKRVEFRRWNTFDPEDALTPLQEGVTPTGQALSQANVEAEISQYGAYVEIADMLSNTSFDDVMRDTPALLGEELGNVLEWITRDVLNSGNNVQYAGDHVSRASITGTDKLTVTEIRKAVRTLKKAKVRWFRGAAGEKSKKPHLVCIVGPDTVFDLQSDALWQDVSKYANAEQIYDGELGRLFGVVFVESTEAKIFKPSVMGAVSAATTGAATFVLKTEPSRAGIKYLSTGGNKLYIDGTAYTLAASSPYVAATRTVTLSAASSLTANAIVSSDDAGALDSATKLAMPVFSTLIFGADAYGTIDLGGNTGAVQSIIKGFGSAGSSDPLNQRATIGGKIMGYTAKILNETWLLRIEHAATV